MEPWKRLFDITPDTGSVFQKVNELTAEICRTQEYCRYRESLFNVKEQEGLMERLNEYRRKAFDLDDEAEGYSQQAEALYEEYEDILATPLVMEFLADESTLSRMLRNVFDGIAEEVGMDISYME